MLRFLKKHINSMRLAPQGSKVCDICSKRGFTKVGCCISRPTCCHQVVYICDNCGRKSPNLAKQPQIIEIYQSKNSSCLIHSKAVVAEIDFLDPINKTPKPNKK